MRLPSFEDDFWELRSGEAAHQARPDTFWIPPLEARQRLQIGQAAKLIFDIEVLDNQPALIETGESVYLCFGAEIPFRAEHVIDIAAPPLEYVEWQLSLPPERHCPRD